MTMLHGADGSWISGQTGTQSWADTLNWLNGIAPGATTGTTNPDTATFGSNTGTTLVTIDAGRNVRSLTFTGTNNAGLYTLGSLGANLGEALRLTSGGSLLLSLNSTTALTIHAPLVLEAASTTSNGSYTITNNSTNVANSATDTNTYKINILGDISGGQTTGSITLNLTGTAGNRSSNASPNPISGLISNGNAAGGLSIIVTGADSGGRGAWSLLNDNNSFTGPVTVNGGTLLFNTITNSGVNSALGAGNTINLGGSAQFKFNGSNAAATDRAIVNNGGVIYANNAVLTLNGTFSTQNGLTFRGGSNVVVNSVITGTGGISRTDPGAVVLNQINTFSGNVVISDGTVRFSSMADKGQNSPLGTGTTITMGQNSATVGRIDYGGTTDASSNRDFVLQNSAATGTGFGRIINSTTGTTLFLSGTVRSNSATATNAASLNLTGNGNGVMSGVIGGTVASGTTPTALALTKDGSGTWALSNANLFTGPTSIAAGTLLAMNSTGSATGTGNVTTSGTGALGGSGIVTSAAGGSITIASGTRLQIGTSHNVAAGAAAGLGYLAGASTLTLGSAANVSINLSGTTQFDLYTAPEGAALGTSDRLVLNTTATSLTFGGAVQVADVSTGRTGWRSGTWQLVNWAGASSATVTGSPTFTLPTTRLASGFGWNTSQFLTQGTIFIEKTSTNHTWLGTTNSSWGNAANWEIGTVPTSSTDVFFQNPSSGVVTHQIDGDRTVRNFFFNGEANHTIQTGSGGVLYTQGTLMEVAGGSQRFSAMLRPRLSSTAPQFEFLNQGTLTFDVALLYHPTSNYSSTLIFSGSGTTNVPHVQRRANTYDVNLRFDGPGIVSFSTSTSTPATTESGFMTGTSTLNGGTISLNQEANLGGNPSSFNPAQLTFNGGTLEARTSFAIDDTNRGITLAANGGTLRVNSPNSLTLGTAMTGAGALQKTGTGNLILTGTSTHTGAINVTAGSLQVGQASIGQSGTGSLSLASGTSLFGTGTLQNTSLNAASGSIIGAGDSLALESLGTLTFSPGTEAGTLQFQAGSILQLGLNLNGQSDLLRIIGQGNTALSLQSDLQIGPSSLTPVTQMSYQLLSWSGLSSTPSFASHYSSTILFQGNGDELPWLNLPDISSSMYFWDISQLSVTGYIYIVPEPTRALLLGLGIACLLMRRRRP